MRLFVAIATMIGLCGSAPLATPPHGARMEVLKPVDHASRDSSFAAFRDRLLEAARRGDIEEVLRHGTDAMFVSFGGERGVQGLREYWAIDDSPAQFLDEFIKVLSLGGTFVGPNEFCAPYVYSTYRSSHVPLEEARVVLRKNVPIHAAQSSTSRVLMRVSYAILRVALREDPPEFVEGWEMVILDKGVRGFVRADDVRSPLDYHACFQKIDAVWKMTAFGGGD